MDDGSREFLIPRNEHIQAGNFRNREKSMRSHLTRLVVVSVMALGFGALGWAQGGATGAITGTVQDPSGA